MLLPHVLKINCAFLDDAACIYYGCSGSAERLIADIEKLAEDMHIPESLNGYLKREDFDFILANCRSGSMKCNPVVLSDDDIIKLLEELL